MREILFRGKRIDNGEWVYGNYHNHSIEKSISFYKVFVGTPMTMYAVIPESIGQYTGVRDRNDTRIFEGDIVRGDSKYFTHSHPYGTIVYDSGEFLIAFDETFEDVENLGAWANDIKVIGNIHDNPELLKRD